MTSHTVYIARVVFPDRCRRCGRESLLKVGYTRATAEARLAEFCKPFGGTAELLELRTCTCALPRIGVARGPRRIPIHACATETLIQQRWVHWRTWGEFFQDPRSGPYECLCWRGPEKIWDVFDKLRSKMGAERFHAMMRAGTLMPR